MRRMEKKREKLEGSVEGQKNVEELAGHKIE